MEITVQTSMPILIINKVSDTYCISDSE